MPSYRGTNYSSSLAKKKNCYLYYQSNGLIQQHSRGSSFPLMEQDPINTNKRPAHHPHLEEVTELFNDFAFDDSFRDEFGMRPRSNVLGCDEQFTDKSNFKPSTTQISTLDAIEESRLNCKLDKAFFLEALVDYYTALDIFDDADCADDYGAAVIDLTPETDVPLPQSTNATALRQSLQEESSGTSTSNNVVAHTETRVRTVLMDMLQEHIQSTGNVIFHDPQLKCEVALLGLCHRYKLPLSAHKHFMEWAKMSVRNQSCIFERRIRTRQEILDHCKLLLGVRASNTFNETIIHWLPELKPTKYHVRSFLSCLFDLLSDQSVVGVGGSNIRLPHSTDPYKKCSKERPQYVSELCHGLWWQKTMAQICKGKKEILVPLIFACDKSHTDTHG